MANASEKAFDVEFRSVVKHFADVKAVDDVSFGLRQGSFHSFLGPSGCGKTTSLRLIAGFEQPDSGAVEIAGQSVVGVPAHKRPVNMVFQHYALFPHMDVAANVGYGLRQRKPRPDDTEIAKRVAEALELVRLPQLAKRRIWELSGGQQQRVALARALINRPTVLLLDEPLAALDRKLRREMQIELQNLQREVGITFVLVTHDQEEALSMSDTIGIMKDGKVVQFGTPEELYDAPVNRYVADFVGESNFFRGAVASSDARGAAITTAGGLTLQAPFSRLGAKLQPGESGIIAVRPEVIGLWQPGRQPAGLDIACPARLLNRIYLGDHSEFQVEAEGLGAVLVRLPKHSTEGQALQPGDQVIMGWQQDRALALAEG
ncbi:ABC transporter ATP-binding protein [Dongia rigui]|uniref:Spermidine/putrescine import ATP-binding protein PotA n=1 Tax=Dongia rigui TaxID=940149 RepID=A0ABU5DXC9_9PROT|nr:ABC transporter ATP-binding protein [Dongia rigui]MDY0871888.1 ABC transporter ATP-binding protein [Dongia rigui]